MNKCDHDLFFCKLCAPTHALNHLLPPTRNRASLRTRGHSYQLPEYSTDLHKKSFLIRSLYSFVKWNSFYSFIVFFGFAALYCTSFWLCFLCLLFDVRLSHLINITYIHTCSKIYILYCVRIAAYRTYATYSMGPINRGLSGEVAFKNFTVQIVAGIDHFSFQS